MRRRDVLGMMAALPALALSRPARAANAVTYLLPAPAFLPVFAPHQLAKARGYFAQHGVEVTFATGKGGADVAKQVALGNVDVGNCLGEVTIVVRANGLPIKNIALLGGHPLYSVSFRSAVGATSIQDLRGKRIGVPSFEDSGYYALLGVLAALKIAKSDVSVQAVGTAGVRQLMISGDLDAITANPDDMVIIQDAGIKIDTFPIETIFPGMAQTVVASDQMIKSRPDMLAGVAKGLVQAVQSVIDDPAAAARDYVKAIPQNADKRDQIERSMRLYAQLVYKTADGVKLGTMEPRKIEALQAALLASQIIRVSSPVDDLYTNQFVA